MTRRWSSPSLSLLRSAAQYPPPPRSRRALASSPTRVDLRLRRRLGMGDSQVVGNGQLTVFQLLPISTLFTLPLTSVS